MEVDRLKRIGNIFDTICDMNNLEQAAKVACRSRKDKLEVHAFLSRKTELLEQLHEQAAI